MGIATPQRRTLPIDEDFCHFVHHTPKVHQVIYLAGGPNLTGKCIFRGPSASAPSSLSGTSAVLQVDELYPPPAEWEATGTRGLTIRTYAASSTGYHLLHIRALTRAAEKHGRFYVDAKRCWWDLTWYRGETVPYETLRKVYTAGSLDMDWTEGGREMTMNKEAWEVLENWYEMSTSTSIDYSSTGPPGLGCKSVRYECDRYWRSGFGGDDDWIDNWSSSDSDFMSENDAGSATPSVHEDESSDSDSSW